MFRYFPSETSGQTVKLDHYLNIDEQGHLLLQKTGDNGGVFTGTQVGGTVSGNKHCSDWTSNSSSMNTPIPGCGSFDASDEEWTDRRVMWCRCSVKAHLYCLEQ